MDNIIGENIKKYRKQKGLTQEELGIAVGEICGKKKIADSSIRRYESGKVEPKSETLFAIAKALDIDISDLNPKLKHRKIKSVYRIGDEPPKDSDDLIKDMLLKIFDTENIDNKLSEQITNTLQSYDFKDVPDGSTRNLDATRNFYRTKYQKELNDNFESVDDKGQIEILKYSRYILSEYQKKDEK